MPNTAPLLTPPLHAYVPLQLGDVPPRIENGAGAYPRAAIGVPPPTNPDTCIVSRFWQSAPNDSCPTGRQIVWADRCQSRPVALSHCRRHPTSGQVTCWNYDPVKLPAQFPARPTEAMLGCVTRNQDFSGTMRWCYDNNLAWCRDLQRTFK